MEQRSIGRRGRVLGIQVSHALAEQIEQEAARLEVTKSHIVREILLSHFQPMRRHYAREHA